MKSVLQLEEEINQLRSELEQARTLKVDYVEERYKDDIQVTSITKDIGDGLWDWDLTTNKVYYSPCWKGMLGYEEHELQPNLDTWSNMVHSEDKPLIIEKIDKYLCGDKKAFEAEMRMRHKNGHYIYVRTRALQVTRDIHNMPIRLIGTHVDITQRKQSELFERRYNKILKMIAQGTPASEIYNEIAYIYEDRHIGIRCSMLELEGNMLLHGGAPSFPKEYCDSVNGLINGPNVGSCGSSTYTGKRVVVENMKLILNGPKLNILRCHMV